MLENALIILLFGRAIIDLIEIYLLITDRKNRK